MPKLNIINFTSTKHRIYLLILIVSISVLFLAGCKKGNTNNAPTNQPNNNQTNPNPTTETNNLPDTDAKSALDKLLQGNDRYINGNFAPRDLTKAKLAELAKGQNPHTIILTCSDSRVIPELFFDQSVGDLFVIRTDGNVLDKSVVVGSMEYAAEKLGTSLIMVVGHENCDAVLTATKEEPATGNKQFIVNEIKPALAKAKTLGSDLVNKTAEENVKLIVENLPKRSEILTNLVNDNKLKIAGGIYSLTEGKVTIVSDIN
ncbi:MAG: carbonic anhydrase [Blastocatellia bacterium]|nr:carbonic anhydrase [Blastocatellia bacterium]